MQHMESGSDERAIGTAPRPLAELAWRSDADRELANAARQGRVDRFSHRLRKVALPTPGRLPRGVALPRVLALPLLAPDNSTAVVQLTRETLLAADATASRELLSNHVAALLDAAAADKSVAPELLSAWLTLLPAAGARVDPEILLRFWLTTLDAAQRYLTLESTVAADEPGIVPELRDELAFRAGIVFRPLAGAAEWEASARSAWRQRLTAAGDEPPWPLLSGRRLLDWLATLVRTTTDAAAYEARLWRKRERVQLRRLCRCLSAGLVNDGTLVNAGGEGETVTSLLYSLGRLAGLPRNSRELRLVRAVAGGRKLRRPTGRRRSSGHPGHQSDARQAALLRTHWGTQATIVGVNFAAHQVALEASIGGERLLHGPWTPRVRIRGESIAVERSWECECWYSDADVDFVELSLDLGDGASLLRQLCLVRTDELLVMAEAVRGVAADAFVELSSELPVPQSLLPECDGLTREMQLLLASRQVRVFPIHLPWERAAFTEGDCRPSATGLTWRTAGQGPRCQVLMMNWSRSAADAPADGGPLTVAEDLRRLPAREACAGRLRLGALQWVYWHNLTAGAVPRSVLGCHSASETVIGRVGESGRIEYLVHVEGRSVSDETAENPAAARETACHAMPVCDDGRTG